MWGERKLKFGGVWILYVDGLVWSGKLIIICCKWVGLGAVWMLARLQCEVRGMERIYFSFSFFFLFAVEVTCE